ncbi:MAG: glycosyltransferase [Planctomycetota bacterium]
MTTVPSISLCMIARNEERFLAGCLESVRDVVDEMIVVDTGSTDATIDIARAAGARVLHSAWTDDFAAARNVGVEAARGTHVLVLDADERLAPNMGDNLLAQATNPDLLLGCLPLYNASSMDASAEEVLSGEKRIGDPVFVPRFFRNLPEMRFERRVHETLTRGFNRLQAAGVGQSIAVGAALIHYGDVPTHRQDLAKDARNERLLRLSLEDDPADGEVAGYLVVELLKTGRFDDAREVGETYFPRFVERNDTRPEGWLPENMVRIGYALALVQTEQGAHDAALRTLADALRHTPDGHPNLDYVEGLAHTGLGALDAAEDAFRRAVAAHGRSFAQPVLPFITNELGRIKLAGLEVLRREAEGALAVLPPASGQWQFAVDLVRAEAELLRNDPTRAMQHLSRYADVPGLAPDWYLLVHRALEALGRDPEDLLEFAERAEPATWLEQRRSPGTAAAASGA